MVLRGLGLEPWEQMGMVQLVLWSLEMVQDQLGRVEVGRD